MINRRFIGLGLLALAFLGLGGVAILSATGLGNRPAPAMVKGYVGGEKETFLANPRIVELLRDRYGVTVDGTRAGSIEMVRGDAAKGDPTLTDEIDFVWPSSQVALALYRQRGGKVVAAENIFNSPIVLYSWAPVADALARQGIVQKRGETYYVPELGKLVALTVVGRTWSQIGLAQMDGPVAVVTTDPTKSNSGNLYFGLLANVLNGGGVVNEQSLGGVLPRLKRYYDSLGFLEPSSADLFQRYQTQGMGAYPLIAGYESQMLEFALQNEAAYTGQFRNQVRILYPQPTVWSSHPIIARTENGARLLQALKDSEIQKLAWERHGFRSGLPGASNDPRVLRVTGVPAQIDRVVNMPGPGVMERIITTLTGRPPAASQHRPVLGSRDGSPGVTAPRIARRHHRLRVAAAAAQP